MNSRTCPHLAPLLDALLKENRPLAAGFANWTEEAGFRGQTLYFDCILDPEEIQRRGWAPKGTECKAFGIAAQYVGVFCCSCNCAIAGYHPDYKVNMKETKGRKDGPFM